MKKMILLVLCGVLCFSGCRNFYQLEKPSGEKITAYQSKLTNKSINILNEVQAIKVTTGMTSESPVPNISLGWWWTAFLESTLKSGGKLIFYKNSKSMFSTTITGTTFLYIENDFNKSKKIKINSVPEFFINLPFLKIGAGKNITKIKISDLKK